MLAAITTGRVGCDRPLEPEPGTDTSRPVSGDAARVDRAIRVLLLDRVPDCEVRVHEPVDLLEVPGGAPLVSGITLPRLSIRFDSGDIRFPELSQTFEARAVDLRPHGSEPIAVGLGDGIWRQFRGSLRLLRRPDACGAVINVVDVEDYLIGVVSAELPATFHDEAFLAQAIAARTYAWYQKQTVGRSRPWDVTATESSQVYLGLERESLVPQAVRAVRGTCGLVCTWSAPEGERIFCSYYSSTCGGSTQAAAPVKHVPPIPPLAGGVKCDYCRHSPAYRWGPVRLEKATIGQRLRHRYPKFNSIGPIERVEVTDKTPDGRAVRLAFIDAQGRAIALEAENFRLAVDPAGRLIKSTFCKITNQSKAVLLTDGRGFGHGIGMCQYGADGLAQDGWTAARILRYYYPCSRLTRAY